MNTEDISFTTDKLAHKGASKSMFENKRTSSRAEHLAIRTLDDPRDGVPPHRLYTEQEGIASADYGSRVNN